LHSVATEFGHTLLISQLDTWFIFGGVRPLCQKPSAWWEAFAIDLETATDIAYIVWKEGKEVDVYVTLPITTFPAMEKNKR